MMIDVDFITFMDGTIEEFRGYDSFEVGEGVTIYSWFDDKKVVKEKIILYNHSIKTISKFKEEVE